ncbi:Zn(2+)-responsive transcriptional regulator [Pseudoalteromonas sp. AS84]|jgi:MerR family Zn(II)-responsive transcriptional regulator of zntA|uniref:Zn(2+)-responsive transcriptional regulator n=2 Tax=root TaxID=1 RepID=A0A7X9U896_9GAMM|nr:MULTISPECIES: Zn(2+)-responsive transcriptional regulator [Pseudoalteromonas]EGI72568.1 zinc-responsive transcriptional regulator [Pseudoalteromonas distincta]MBH0089398.1 Zn(2+)-responsive transcriptional regulator [Pseudoalteromonas sp. NSLLW218]NMF49384.1 Zn(2+)-responsive transcriptional regulator [Pseudoalteromonas arctica]HDZ33404.1 Zn(2+)-responsive transcriptional regulator [Pseudoalteromonas sp.]|tara:strand:- start:407 stop:817 length:411 start_codon:yes stop_codon:yes gene_type:complete
MRIGELSHQLGISNDTLRYYEKQGLLTPNRRNSAGYRLYDNNDLKVMHFIIRAKNIGFSLAEIKDLLLIKFEKSSHSCSEVKKITLEKRDLVAQRIKELQQFHQSLTTLADKCCGSQHIAENCSILSVLEDIDDVT